MNEPFTDTFADDRPNGKTIGSSSKVVRKGVDRERAIAIDNQALRFKLLI